MSDLDKRAGGASYLVRLWREGGDSASGQSARVYVRELRTGEERYLKDIDGLADYLDDRHDARQPRDADDPDSRADRRRAG